MCLHHLSIHRTTKKKRARDMRCFLHHSLCSKMMTHNMSRFEVIVGRVYTCYDCCMDISCLVFMLPLISRAIITAFDCILFLCFLPLSSLHLFMFYSCIIYYLGCHVKSCMCVAYWINGKAWICEDYKKLIQLPMSTFKYGKKIRKNNSTICVQTMYTQTR